MARTSLASWNSSCRNNGVSNPLHLCSGDFIETSPHATSTQLLRRLRRAVSIIGRLHLPELEHAEENGNRHRNHQKRGKAFLQAVYALAVRDVAGEDQAENGDIDDPVQCFWHDEVQGAKARELVNHERQDSHRWQ